MAANARKKQDKKTLVDSQTQQVKIENLPHMHQSICDTARSAVFNGIGLKDYSPDRIVNRSRSRIKA